MIIILALRNVLRNLRRLLPMMLTLILVFTLLITGNAILNSIINSLYGVYALNITGDITVSPVAEGNFTVFGSDQLLVGQYLIPPTLTEADELQRLLATWPEVRACTGLVSSGARVEVEGQRFTAAVFGVDFVSYPQAVPGLQLVAGAFPQAAASPGIVIQESSFNNPESLIGKKALLAASLGRSFTLRELTVTGVFRYPVSDSLLDKVVLIDLSTARALNGYLYSDGPAAVLSDKEEEVITGGLDDLFSRAETFPAAASSVEPESVDPLALFADGVSLSTQGEAEDQGAWNFLLVSLHRPRDAQKVSRRLAANGYGEKSGYLVRGWSASVGGNAQLAVFLQLLFNLGLLFVSFGAVIIAANSLLLSVLERTGEIGTLRALGADRLRISLMIFLETFIVVFGSAFIGILLGKIAIDRLNDAGLVVDNPYVKILFGGEAIHGSISFGSVLSHLGVALAFTLLSMLYPLKRALGIQPAEAMSE